MNIIYLIKVFSSVGVLIFRLRFTLYSIALKLITKNKARDIIYIYIYITA